MTGYYLGMTKNNLVENLKGSLYWSLEKSCEKEFGSFNKYYALSLATIIPAILSTGVSFIYDGPESKIDIFKAFFLFSGLISAPITLPSGYFQGENLREDIYDKRPACKYLTKKGKEKIYTGIEDLENKILYKNISLLKKTAQEMNLPLHEHSNSGMFGNFDYLSIYLPTNRVIGPKGRLKIKKVDFNSYGSGEYGAAGRSWGHTSTYNKTKIKYPFLVDLEDTYNQLSEFNNKLNLVKTK